MAEAVQSGHQGNGPGDGAAVVTPLVSRIGHVGLAVRDLERSVAFYEALGFRVTERFTYPLDEVGHGTAVAAGAFVRCESSHHALSLFSLKAQSRGPADGHPYGLHHVAFELPTPERLLLMYRLLRDRGLDVVARVGGPGNQPRCYVRDPDGNLLEFFWGIDQIGWDGIARPYAPITEIDLEEFDFEGFERERQRRAEEQRAALNTWSPSTRSSTT